jgi:hypothetical protein
VTWATFEPPALGYTLRTSFSTPPAKGRSMHLIRTSLRQLRRSPRRRVGPEWWAYFGSFGDDFFHDD